MSIASKISSAIDGLASIVKVILQSRKPLLSDTHTAKPIIVLGNGPSLSQSLTEYQKMLQECDVMAVNFFGSTPDYLTVRPNWYIMADPLFFEQKDQLPNIKALIDDIAKKTDWAMTLLVPVGSSVSPDIKANPNISVKTFNAVGAEGLGNLTHKLFDWGLAMPRPRNVLIPAIMCAIRAGYKDIFLLGADHSWLTSLSVNDDNIVISKPAHFYKDSNEEQWRVDTLYSGIKLHEMLKSYMIAFKSYHDIAKYADYKNINIYNSTPGSFIDAFPRKSISK